ncbi:MAG: putative holin [Undibacterium sp.]|uniref:putative holin n=1 Tax=Undibacterium sp. TaxID=1914977 RepID=UPI00271B37C5|nr:putative holin [Undibacterium sp.]MDO8654208.1 putative holin [Undibacterium sp.]
MKRVPRMTDWLLFALVLSLLIFALSPQQLPVSIYKINLIAIAGVVGYWLDRSLFPYARPDSFLAHDEEQDGGIDGGGLIFSLDQFIQNDVLFVAAQIRRAIIVAASMIAVGLGA